MREEPPSWVLMAYAESVAKNKAIEEIVEPLLRRFEQNLKELERYRRFPKDT